MFRSTSNPSWVPQGVASVNAIQNGLFQEVLELRANHEFLMLSQDRSIVCHSGSKRSGKTSM
jgi:hypothetical protein